MANFLEYRPHLEYKRKLNAVLRSYQDDEWAQYDDGGGDRDIASPGAGDRPSDKLMGKGYIPSQAIKETVDLTPTDTVMKFVETKGKIATLVDKIVGNLRKDVTTSPTIDEYIKAREENDADVIYEFEDYHTGNLEGSTAAEALPILYRLQDEMDTLSEFLGDYLFSDELVQDIDYLAEQIERLRIEEEQDIKQLIEKDVNITLDEDKLKERNHILAFLYKRADAVGGFTDEIDILISVTPESIYHGTGSRIAALAASQSVLRKEFIKLNARRFTREMRNASDAAERMIRLVNPEYKKSLLTEAVRLQEEKLGSRDALSALYLANPQSEDDMMNIFLMDLADDIEGLKDECDSLVEDLYKITDLEHLQNNDYLVSLEGKNICRHMNYILKGIEGIDVNDRDVDKEIEKLFQ